MQDEIRAQSVDERVGEVVGPIADRVVSIVFYSVDIGGASLPLIVVWLVVAGAFFTVYLGFLNVRGFKHSIDLVRGKYSDPNDAGEVSHFQARSPRRSRARSGSATLPAWRSPSRSAGRVRRSG